MPKKASGSKNVEAIVHKEAKRRNIPTAEHEPIVGREKKAAARQAQLRRQEVTKVAGRTIGTYRLSRNLSGFI